MTADYTAGALHVEKPALRAGVPYVTDVRPNSDEERRRARLVVAAHALGAADCAELLVMLALDKDAL